jgi:hypothetical protein
MLAGTGRTCGTRGFNRSSKAMPIFEMWDCLIVLSHECRECQPYGQELALEVLRGKDAFRADLCIDLHRKCNCLSSGYLQNRSCKCSKLQMTASQSSLSSNSHVNRHLKSFPPVIPLSTTFNIDSISIDILSISSKYA